MHANHNRLIAHPFIPSPPPRRSSSFVSSRAVPPPSAARPSPGKSVRAKRSILRERHAVVGIKSRAPSIAVSASSRARGQSTPRRRRTGEQRVVHADKAADLRQRRALDRAAAAHAHGQ
eukprot:4812500-Pleurochrysis_carterae.AAC.3